ncbi:hypothetical protein [Kitasatospora sp. NPDC059571]|uniref:hypothetical protein n=1 Tax=Kitasatospora sp. NPDC059571 TaxID=3346871 RepID=UPI0036CBCF09
MTLLGLGISVGVFAAQDLALVSGRTGSPLLRMTVDGCRWDHHGRSRTAVCQGHGDPAAGGTPAGRWELADADRLYDAGTVVQVRCSGAGACVEPGAHAFANDAAGLLLGLAGTSGGALCALAGLARRLPSDRLDPLGTPRRRLAVFSWFGALTVLTVALIAVWSFS